VLRAEPLARALGKRVDALLHVGHVLEGPQALDARSTEPVMLFIPSWMSSALCSVSPLTSTRPSAAELIGQAAIPAQATNRSTVTVLQCSAIYRHCRFFIFVSHKQQLDFSRAMQEHQTC